MPLRGFTERTITSAAELRRVLAEVRRTGVAISHGQVEVFAQSIAAPVYRPEDAVIAAVSLVVHERRGDGRAFVPVVRAAARGISRALGAPSALRQPEGARRT
ncbi:IclR family transcriptional regulator domain-containing protein [Actinocorallia herbida]|uniref:IclR family transcriptional regulator domain-containing protein n=1 Tax=Actinocorallia herbida TaxID=58109 RepID=UPI001B87C328|nr:IclR family transcriptional regulator C-terminal domain-containing protein [Actinocorallia herbida]